MIKLTSGMGKDLSRPFWDRLSAALARSYPKGSTANVFITQKNFNKLPRSAKSPDLAA